MNSGLVWTGREVWFARDDSGSYNRLYGAAMNEFGPHTAEVQEVIDFVRSGGVLREPFRADLVHDFKMRVVHSLDTVLRYRYGHHLPNPEHWTSVEEWRDIGEQDSEALHDASNDIPGYRNAIIPKIIDTSNAIQEHLSQQLADILPDTEIVNIADNFEMIMRYRAVFGHNNYFDEKLFRVYEAYGYPCGWVGEYPEGELVVFSR